MGCELGMSLKEIEELKIIPGQDETLNTEYNKTEINSLNEKILLKIEKELNQINKINKKKDLEINKLNKKDSLYNSTLTLNRMNKKVENIHSLYIELIVLYFVFFIGFISLSIIYSFKQDDEIQELNGKWRYHCPLESINSFITLVELILILYLLSKILKVWNYMFVFKILKNIGYSVIIWTTLGPITNVFNITYY